MQGLKMVTLGDLTASCYPKAIRDERYKAHFEKLSKIKDADWQCIFLQQVITKDDCIRFLKVYEDNFGTL